MIGNASRNRKVGRGAVIFLVVFALFLAGVGTFVGYLAATMIVDWAQAQSSDEVAARILSADGIQDRQQ